MPSDITLDAPAIARGCTSPRPPVALTFDDGYSDMHTIARPLLEKYEMQREWQINERLQTEMSRWNVLSQAPCTPRQRAYLELINWFQYMSPEQRRMGLNSLRACTGSKPVLPGTHRPMSAEEVKDLHNGGLVTIGAHTVTHTRLASLPPSRQHAEMQDSKRCLEALLGTRIDALAYPYGAETSYTIPRVTVQNWTAEEFEGRLTAILRI